MKKLAQLLRNTYELILAFLLLIISYSEGEEEVQEITPENKTAGGRKAAWTPDRAPQRGEGAMGRA